MFDLNCSKGYPLVFHGTIMGNIFGADGKTRLQRYPKHFNQGERLPKSLRQMSVCFVLRLGNPPPPPAKKKKELQQRVYPGVARVARIALYTKLEASAFFLPKNYFRRMGHEDEDEVCYGLVCVFFWSPWLKWYFPDFIFFQVGDDDDGDSGLQFFEDVINLPCYL